MSWLSKTMSYLFQKLDDASLIINNKGLKPTKPLALLLVFNQVVENPNALSSDPHASPNTGSDTTTNYLTTTATRITYVSGRKRSSEEAQNEETTDHAEKAPRVQVSYRRAYKPCVLPVVSLTSFELSEKIICNISTAKIPNFLKATPGSGKIVTIELGETWKEDMAVKRGLLEGGVWCGSGYYKDCFRVSHQISLHRKAC